MSWREIMGQNPKPHPHNSHNPQNPPLSGNSEDIGDIGDSNSEFTGTPETARLTLAELGKAGAWLKLEGDTLTPGGAPLSDTLQALIAENQGALLEIKRKQARCSSCRYLYPCGWSRNLSGTCPPDYSFVEAAPC